MALTTTTLPISMPDVPITDFGDLLTAGANQGVSVNALTIAHRNEPLRNITTQALNAVKPDIRAGHRMAFTAANTTADHYHSQVSYLADDFTFTFFYDTEVADPAATAAAHSTLMYFQLHRWISGKLVSGPPLNLFAAPIATPNTSQYSRLCAVEIQPGIIAVNSGAAILTYSYDPITLALTYIGTLTNVANNPANNNTTVFGNYIVKVRAGVGLIFGYTGTNGQATVTPFFVTTAGVITKGTSTANGAVITGGNTGTNSGMNGDRMSSPWLIRCANDVDLFAVAMLDSASSGQFRLAVFRLNADNSITSIAGGTSTGAFGIQNQTVWNSITGGLGIFMWSNAGATGFNLNVMARSPSTADNYKVWSWTMSSADAQVGTNFTGTTAPATPTPVATPIPYTSDIDTNGYSWYGATNKELIICKSATVIRVVGDPTVSTNWTIATLPGFDIPAAGNTQATTIMRGESAMWVFNNYIYWAMNPAGGHNLFQRTAKTLPAANAVGEFTNMSMGIVVRDSRRFRWSNLYNCYIFAMGNTVSYYDRDGNLLGGECVRFAARTLLSSSLTQGRDAFNPSIVAFDLSPEGYLYATFAYSSASNLSVLTPTNSNLTYLIVARWTPTPTRQFTDITTATNFYWNQAQMAGNGTVSTGNNTLYQGFGIPNDLIANSGGQLLIGVVFYQTNSAATGLYVTNFNFSTPANGSTTISQRQMYALADTNGLGFSTTYSQLLNLIRLVGGSGNAQYLMTGINTATWAVTGSVTFNSVTGYDTSYAGVTGTRLVSSSLTYSGYPLWSGITTFRTDNHSLLRWPTWNIEYVTNSTSTIWTPSKTGCIGVASGLIQGGAALLVLEEYGTSRVLRSLDTVTNGATSTTLFTYNDSVVDSVPSYVPVSFTATDFQNSILRSNTAQINIKLPGALPTLFDLRILKANGDKLPLLTRFEITVGRTFDLGSSVLYLEKGDKLQIKADRDWNLGVAGMALGRSLS